MGSTMVEKVMSRQHLRGTGVRAGDMLDAKLDGLLISNYIELSAAYRRMGFPAGPPVVFDPDRVYLMNEHVQPPRTLPDAQANWESKTVAKRLALPHFYESEMGICHQMMLDYGHARPGELIVGTDSHTISYGAINAFATGIGIDEAAYAIAFGELYFTVPETIKIILNGATRPYPFAKDIILYLAGQYSDSFAQGKAIEFTGSLAAEMDMSSRLTLADQAVEVGAKFGVFDFDEKTEEYLSGHQGRAYRPVTADPDASYADVIEVDADSIGFQVASPFRFDNVGPVEDVAGIPIDQARIGSCANGRFEDIEIAARMLTGRKVAPGVRFYISPASMSVYRQCAEAGLIQVFIDAGAQFENPGCTICQTPGIVLNEEVCITATTRNYHGRFGGATCANAQIYLASPATVAASALTGVITDPTEYLDV